MNRYIATGGLRVAQLRNVLRATAATDGPDVSWITRCRLGDDQGQEGACAIFALASWLEIMRGQSITNEACIDLYHATLATLGRPDGDGLTFEEAFFAAQGAGWFTEDDSLHEESDLSYLGNQPLLAGYEITPAWDDVSDQGCLDHVATGKSRGGHAVVIVGH